MAVGTSTPALSDHIRTTPAENCPFCRSPGQRIHEKLNDRSYQAPGEWSFRKCPQPTCGAIWLDPVPTLEDIGKAYQTYYTQAQPEPTPGWVRKVVYAPWRAYLAHRFGYKQGTGPRWLSLFWWVALFHPGGRDELDALAMYLEAPPPGARVLDVGCGSGKLLPQMRAMGWQAEGIEVDPKAVETAQKRGLPVKLGQLQDLSFPDAHFDAIHMSHVIEHVHDPAALLRECYRILKPGGRLVVLTPNTLSYGYRRFGSSWLNLDPPRHLILFNRTNLRRLVEQQGYRLERLDSSVRTGWVYGALSRQIQRTNRGEMSDLGKASCLFHGLLYQWRARLERNRDPEAGDELVLIARKPG